MIIYKGAAFSDWAVKYCISDEMLISAVNEMNGGVYEANLGGSVYKKRIAIGNKGKSAGARTILAFLINEKAFFIYLHLTETELNKAVQESKLIKVG